MRSVRLGRFNHASLAVFIVVAAYTNEGVFQVQL